MRFLLFSFLLLLAACAQRNDFEQFYESLNVPMNSLVKADEVKIEETSDMTRAIERWGRKGYVVLGRSNMYARWVPRSLLFDMGEEKGATVVLVYAEYIGEVNRTSTTYSSTRSEEVRGLTKITTYTSIKDTRDYKVSMYYQDAVFMAKKKQ